MQVKKGEENVMSVKEIIFPVDFSERSAHACAYAEKLAAKLRAKLTLLHVVKPLPPGSTPLDRMYKGLGEELELRKQAAEIQLAEFQRQHLPHVPVDRIVRIGEPAQAIVAYAGGRPDRLIFLPARQPGPVRRLLLGSVAAAILQEARCPVLTAPVVPEAGPAITPRHVLCLVKLDRDTDRVLKAAAEIAIHLGAEVTAFHVAPGAEPGVIAFQGSPAVAIESARRSLRDAVYRAGGTASVCVGCGQLAHETARAVRAHHADLLIIGKGAADNEDDHVSKDAYRLVRETECPVLCI